MTYRDPREALQAENDCLRQELRETQDELAAARSVPAGQEYERRRWAVGMRCLGSLAMVAPFLAMMTLCEHRAVRRASWHSAMATSSVPALPVALGGCPMARPAMGFERFTAAVERPARVTASSYPGVAAGASCTVRVAPVSMLEFNCHVEVVCNGDVVYGALPMGYAHCDVDQHRVTRAVDPDPTAIDGDAAITADFGARSMVIEDRSGYRTTRLSLDLTQPLAL